MALHKVSAFAQLAHVSVRTLHHYDALGLLKPAQVDPHSGYRYYQLDQIKRLNRIRALRELGLSLEDVRLCLDEAQPAEAIQALLRAQHAQLQARIAHAHDQTQLRETETRLAALAGQAVAVLDVVLKPLPEQHVLLCDTFIDEAESIESVFKVAYAALRTHGLHRDCQAITCLYLHHLAWTGQPCLPRHIQAAFSFSNPISRYIPFGNERVLQPARLPYVAVCASLVHHGADFVRDDAHDALSAWVTRQGYRLSAPPREVYFRRGQADDHLTEIQFPLTAPALPYEVGTAPE